MNKLLSCRYNMDTNRVEARFVDGSAVVIDCIAIEDEYGNTPAQRAELDWLRYNKPLEYTQLVLSGEIEHYLSLGCEHGRLEIRQKKKPKTSRYIKKFQALFCLNWKFTGRSASSWGQVKEGSQMALFSFISLSMRLPFSCSRTSPYATLHNLPAIWCKSGVVVGVVDFRPKCPVYRSDLQRNGLWLPWWLPRKSPSWC
jgi:hypothetical protein